MDKLMNNLESCIYEEAVAKLSKNLFNKGLGNEAQAGEIASRIIAAHIIAKSNDRIVASIERGMEIPLYEKRS